MTALEKAADNAWLKVVARVAMALTLPILMAVSTLIWNDHEAIGTTSGQVAGLSQQITAAKNDITNLQAWESSTNSTVSSTDIRLSAVEINQKNGADRGALFQSDTKAILAKLQDQNLAILQQLAAINATLKGKGDP